jgi:hypothetical protein
MYKGITKKNKQNLQDAKLAKLDVKTHSCQKLTAYNRPTIFFHIKNQSLAINQSWKWEACFEGVEVEK